ncbi:hypothetical protein [Stenotrophomonas bentonitica]|uniref:hypothetical protein n=1 Tax=Stenotrophomonas bentonitica TaxID=1450134 RepID=UPI0031B9E676
MTDTDFIRAMQQGLPPIAPPATPFCTYCGGSGDVHSIDGEWRGICTECDAFAVLHPEHSASGLSVTEYRMDGVLLGNADIEMNNHEAMHGICSEGDCE